MDVETAKAWRRRRGGRPVLPDHAKRSHKLIVWVNDAELADIRVAAAEHRMHTAAYVRLAVTHAPIIRSSIPPLNREAWLELARLVANINQYQAAINNGSATAWPGGTLRDLAEAVHALRLSLVSSSLPAGPSPLGVDAGDGTETAAGGGEGETAHD